MILSDLRDYLQERKRAALMDMANRFDSDPEALRGMLEKWIAKGKVRKVPYGGGACVDGCDACGQSGNEIYEWKA